MAHHSHALAYKWNHTIQCEKEVSCVRADKIGCNVAVIYEDKSCEVFSLWKELSPLVIPHSSFLTFVHNNFTFEDESNSSVVISLSTSELYTDINAWASESLQPLEIEINGLSQLLTTGIDLSGIKTNNTLPFKCERVSSNGHLVVFASFDPSYIFLFNVRRHRSTLRIRVQQIIGPLSNPILSLETTPTHIIASESDGVKFWEIKPVELTKPNERTPNKKSVPPKKDNKEKEKDKEFSITTGVNLAELHSVTSNLVIGTTLDGDVYAISLSLLNNPSVPVGKLTPVVTRINFPCKMVNYTILPPSPRFEQGSSSGTLVCVNSQYTIHSFPLDELAKFVLSKEEAIIEDTPEPTQQNIPSPRQSLMITAPITNICIVPFDSLIVVCEKTTMHIHLL